MVDRVLVWAARSPRLQRQVTQNPVARRAAHRFVAGERLDEALDVTATLNSRGIGGILDLLGEGALLTRPTRDRPPGRRIVAQPELRTRPDLWTTASG
jgi:hypothetical protein